VTGLLAKTFSPGTAGKDAAGAFDFDYRGDRFNASATYLDIAERFNAEMGFIRRTDVRNTNVRAGWTPWPGWPGFRNLDFSTGVDYFENHDGIRESRTENVGFGFTRRDNSRFRISAEREFDLLTSSFRLGPTEISGGATHGIPGT